MEHEGDFYTNCNWYSWYSQSTINKGTGGLWNKRTCGDFTNIIEISPNTEKSPGDLRRLAITQTSVKDHQLTLLGKTLKEPKKKKKKNMHTPESVSEIETYKTLRAFQIQTDHLISSRRLYLVIVNKKRTCRMVEFTVLADHRVKLKESEKRDNTWTLLENWKTIEQEGDSGINCNWLGWYSHQRIATGTGGLGSKKTSGEHQNSSIAAIDQNTKKSPEDLRRLAVTQTLVENHQLTLVWKTRKGIK